MKSVFLVPQSWYFLYYHQDSSRLSVVSHFFPCCCVLGSFSPPVSHDPAVWPTSQYASKCEAVWSYEPMRVSQSSVRPLRPDTLWSSKCDLCAFEQEWACAHGCLPYLRCLKCAWVCKRVVKQMESISFGILPHKWFNELLAGSQSRPPATSEVTPWCLV